jgi:hypothetical protein
MFSAFEAEFKPKFGELPVFQKGVQAYKELLCFDADLIMEELESDLGRIRKWIKNWQHQKTICVAAHIEKFSQTIRLITLGLGKEDLLKLKRQEALISIKRLTYFGTSSNGTYPVDFEWPTKDEIMAMPLDKPIRAVAFKWHISDNDTSGNYIGAIQIILENGCASPVFRGAG